MNYKYKIKYFETNKVIFRKDIKNYIIMYRKKCKRYKMIVFSFLRRFTFILVFYKRRNINSSLRIKKNIFYHGGTEKTERSVKRRIAFTLCLRGKMKR
jgi:hypothetical protein